jgi:hypothetical protein
MAKEGERFRKEKEDVRWERGSADPIHWRVIDPLWRFVESWRQKGSAADE